MGDSHIISVLKELDKSSSTFLDNYEEFYTGEGEEFFTDLSALRENAPMAKEDSEEAEEYYQQLKKKLTGHSFALFNLDVRMRLQRGEACPDIAYDQWGEDFFQWFNERSNDRQTVWLKVLNQANVSAAKPSASWLKKAQGLIDGDEEFLKELELVLNLITNPRRSSCNYYYWDTSIYMMQQYTGHIFHPDNVDTVKGLAWFGSLIPTERMAAVLSSVGVATIKKIAGRGARSKKITNAAIIALAELNLPSALGYINRIDDANQYSQTRTFIKRKTTEIREALSNQGFDDDDIHEIAAPSMELNSDFEVHEDFDGVEGIIRIESLKKVSLLWLKGEKEQKSIPAEIKNSHKDEIKAFKKHSKAIESAISSWRSRIESYFLKDRQWTFDTWKQRFIDNPLLHLIAQDLIWQSQDKDQATTFMYRDGTYIDSNGENCSIQFDDSSPIILWHPVDQTVEEVERWRELMFQLQLVQPFKQAFREVYVVTDAEKATELYSNRFAAHIIFQPKFAAIAKQRGWSFTMIGTSGEYCMHNDAIKSAEAIGAVFCVQETAPDHITDMSFYEYLATDQVRFFVGGQRVKVEDVRPMLFSELMRDVDLFVGTCSVATDPEWMDHGIEGYTGQWKNTAFGELTSSAGTRKAALERILPRLNIAKKCEIKGRFLMVKGAKREYKIHLGSSNILMSPNDQYLCIVRDQFSSQMRKVNKIFLPFEEDYMLSLIISKAFLLANDDKIDDGIILSQIDLN